MGYIESVQGGGNYISRMPLSSTFSVIKLKLAMKKSVLINIWEMRFIIEVEAAGLAADRSTDAELLEIETALQNYVNRVENKEASEKIADAGEKFHEAITKAAHNEILTDTLNGLLSLLEMSRLFSNQVEGSTERAVAEHRRIFEQLSLHDVEKTKLAMKEHLLSTYDDLQAYFESLETDDLVKTEQVQ
jgi:GntR family transcriptional repressor for pyruvate dehydrogenase complex